MEEVKKMIPLGRLGYASEVAGMCAFLAVNLVADVACLEKSRRRMDWEEEDGGRRLQPVSDLTHAHMHSSILRATT
jgi:hypothetical protein